MSGYREHEPLWRHPRDAWTLPYISARAGFGLLAISAFMLVANGAVVASAIAAVIGAALLIYGLRNY